MVGTPEVGDGLKTVKLAPWGKVESMNGDFLVDDEGVREVLRTFAEHGTAVPIDVEHESLPERQPTTGSRGAIGWVEKIWGSAADKGLFALVRWSDAGKALIREDRFRYLSPVFWIRKDDRRAIGLHSAAVTTLPAIARMERLAASQTKEKPMSEETTANAETTAAADENAAIAAGVRTALGLPENANKDAVALALSVRATGAANAELATMKQAECERSARAHVERYIVSNQLNPNDKPAMEAAVRLAMSDPATLDAIFKNATPYATPGRTTPPSSRQVLIAKAEREYCENVAHQRATSLKAFTNQALRDKGLAALTEDEAVGLSVG